MKDINLLPDDIRVSEDQFKTDSSSGSPVKVITIVIAVIVLIAATFVLPKVWIVVMNSQLADTNKAIESADYNGVKQIKSDIVKVQDTINLKNEIITDIDTNSVSVYSIFNTVGNSMPKGCSIEKISFAEKAVSIQGKADSGPKASEFLSNLNRMSSLKVTDSSIESKTDGTCNFRYAFTFDGKGGN